MIHKGMAEQQPRSQVTAAVTWQDARHARTCTNSQIHTIATTIDAAGCFETRSVNVTYLSGLDGEDVWSEGDTPRTCTGEATFSAEQ
jgi:hypothetical protein